MASELKVIFDHRERYDITAIAEELERKHKLFVIDRTEGEDSAAQLMALNGGDITIVRRDTLETLCLVEHKQVNDFRNSLQPGHLQPKRLHDQLARMAGKNVPRLILLLSGDYSQLEDHMQKSLLTITTRLQNDPDSPIQVVRMETLSHMAQFVARTVESLMRAGEDTRPPLTGPPFHELMVAIRKQETSTPAKLYHTLLQLVPGCSAQVACTITTEYPTLKRLRRAVRKSGNRTVCKLTSNNRHLPAPVGTAIGNLLNDECLLAVSEQNVCTADGEEYVLADPAGITCLVGLDEHSYLVARGCVLFLHHFQCHGPVALGTFDHPIEHAFPWEARLLVAWPDGLYFLALDGTGKSEKLRPLIVCGLALVNDTCFAISTDNHVRTLSSERWNLMGKGRNLPAGTHALVGGTRLRLLGKTGEQHWMRTMDGDAETVDGVRIATYMY